MKLGSWSFCWSFYIGYVGYLLHNFEGQRKVKALESFFEPKSFEVSFMSDAKNLRFSSSPSSKHQLIDLTMFASFQS
jgi:hypothetical protein